MDVMSMKSSRRKQSKPIRVSYNEDSEMPLNLQPPPPSVDDELVNGDSMDASDPGDEKENEMHMSNIIAYNKSAETFPGNELISERIKDIPSEPHDSSPLNLVRDSSSFPTAYHRLGSEFFMKSSFVSNGHKPDNSILDSENNIDKNGNDVVDGEFGEAKYDDEKKDRSGIFHPDAYCELCDKEFCNKYFLKTHKANKHGIYDNSTSPFTAGVNPLPPSLVLPQDYSPYKLNLDFPLPPLKTSVNPVKPPTPQLTPSSLHTPSPSRGSPPTTQPLSQSAKPSSTPMTSAKSKSSFNTPTSNASGSEHTENKKPVGQDMEDFCEICQKHFCNKYYLKKHKNDVHGIPPPDTPLSSGKRGGRPPNSELKLPATPVSSDSPLIPHSLANLPGLPNMPGVMVLNPFLPPMLIPAGSLMNQHGPLPPRPPHLPMSSAFPFSGSASLPVTTMSDSKTLSPGSSTTLPTSSSPTGSFSSETLRNMGIPIPDGASPSEALRRMGLLSPDGQVASDALRGMGILNTEAFCDICRKEFCNKYFLKVHKANKHGIFTDEPLLPPGMGGGMSMTLPTKPSDVTTTSDSSVLPSDRDKEACDNNRVESSPKSSTPMSQSSDYVINCNMCKSDFASKYAYRVHRIQAHGMINEPFNESELAEEAYKLHNGDLPKQVSSKIAEEISAIERNAEQSGFPTMFGSMVAAKLADRVNCDICNKELCNKYFLKAHKLKVHGIDVAAQERSPKPGTAMLSADRPPLKLDFSPNAASRLDFSSFGRSFKPDTRDSRPNSTTSLDTQTNQPAERPSNEELVKLGMDPEAYCEICKKEFCSKYFLRTHKQNIHGIPPKSESQESSLHKPLSMAPHLALSTPLLPSSFMGAMGPMGSMGSMGSMASMGPLGAMGIPASLSAQTKPMNLSASNNSGSGSSSYSSSSKHRNSLHGQKWKEPNNTARVTCDLCNKELCNKYFLRTHKINKHGILPEELSPATSQNMSPNNSDMETSSNSSIPTDLSVDRSIHSPKLNLENSKLFTNKPDEGHFGEALNLKIKSEQERLFNNYASEMADQKFKSSKWQPRHILKDPVGFPALSPTMEKAFNIGGRMAPLEQRTCSVCSIVFPSEMSMQLHMIQEHNAQVTIKTEPHSPTYDNIDSRNMYSGTLKRYNVAPRFKFSLKQKFYSCSVCNHKSAWLSKILSHEKNVHGIIHQKKKFCHKSNSKQYRCTTCDRSFPTAIQCHQHIRQDHIRRRSFRINNRPTYQRHSCSQCSFSTRYRKQLQRHQLRCHNVPHKINQSGLMIEDMTSGNNINSLNLHAEALNGCENGEYTMQTFKIKQCNEDGVFVASVVQMPVLQKLKNSASVSFMVTPLEEH